MKIDRIIKYCKQYDITVTELERRVDLTRGSIKRWVNSEPSVDKVQKVADYFDCTTDYLLGRSDLPGYVLWTDLPQELKDEEIQAIQIVKSALDDGISAQDIQDILALTRRLERKYDEEHKEK